MTDQPKRSRWKRRALWALLMLACYPLSAGPVGCLFWKLQDTGHIHGGNDYLIDAAIVFYTPLGLIPGGESLLFRYVEFWAWLSGTEIPEDAP